MSHPGSLSCSEAKISKDYELNTCTIDVTTTARLSGDYAHIPVDELELLGWMAIHQTAEEQISELNHKATVPSSTKDAESRHRRIVGLLEASAHENQPSAFASSSNHCSKHTLLVLIVRATAANQDGNFVSHRQPSSALSACT